MVQLHRELEVTYRRLVTITTGNLGRNLRKGYEDSTL